MEIAKNFNVTKILESGMKYDKVMSEVSGQVLMIKGDLYAVVI